MKYSSKNINDKNLTEKDLYELVHYVGHHGILKIIASHPNGTETLRRLVKMKINGTQQR